MPEDFRKATDQLLAGISHQQLADALAVSVPTVRQARLDESANAHRSAPEGWEAKVAAMAEREANRLQRLAKSLQRKSGKWS
jgi:hypothetical protein